MTKQNNEIIIEHFNGKKTRAYKKQLIHELPIFEIEALKAESIEKANERIRCVYEVFKKEIKVESERMKKTGAHTISISPIMEIDTNVIGNKVLSVIIIYTKYEKPIGRNQNEI